MSASPARPSGSSSAGFVISEFVVVVVFVLALIIVVVVSVNGIDDQSASRECETELRAIKAASEQFYAELNFYPPNDQALKDAGLLDLADSPNYRVVAAEGADHPTYETVGDRCR